MYMLSLGEFLVMRLGVTPVKCGRAKCGGAGRRRAGVLQQYGRGWCIRLCCRMVVLLALPVMHGSSFLSGGDVSKVYQNVSVSAPEAACAGLGSSLGMCTRTCRLLALDGYQVAVSHAWWVYSLLTTLSHFCHMCRLPALEAMKRLYRMAVEKKVSWRKATPGADKLPASLSALLDTMLEPDPSKRATLQQVLDSEWVNEPLPPKLQVSGCEEGVRECVE